MAGTISGNSPAGLGGQGRRRARQLGPRTGRAGMAGRAYASQAVLDAAANGTTISGQDPLELMLIELMGAAGLVRRIAANLDQAVAKLNATGQATGDLPAHAPGSLR